jgi:hypothetical protein
MATELQKILHQVFLRSPPNLFDEFMVECQAWYARPAHSLTEMRSRDNKKIRGDIYEEFCVLYLKHVKGYQTVWRLEDVPDTVLETLKMKRRDMGIDLIVQHDGSYKAVQCKYKQRGLRKCSVTWSALSTFYALCLRSGPWSSYIVMTTADYCSHQGEKTEKDLSFCIGSMRAITKEQWIQMCGSTGLSIESESKILSIEGLRAARLARFGVQSETKGIE